MCAETGIGGHKTNHSLHAAGASELFEAGVPEKNIKERAGHRSLEALRIYKRTSKQQNKAVSVILSEFRHHHCGHSYLVSVLFAAPIPTL